MAALGGHLAAAQPSRKTAVWHLLGAVSGWGAGGQHAGESEPSGSQLHV